MNVDGQGGVEEFLLKLSISVSISLLSTQTLKVSSDKKGWHGNHLRESKPDLPTRTDIVAEVRVVPGDNVAWGIVVADVDCPSRTGPLGTSDRPGALPNNLGEVTYVNVLVFNVKKINDGGWSGTSHRYSWNRV